MVSILKQSVLLLSQQQSVINQLSQQSSRTLATVAKKYVFAKQFKGEPKATDFTLVEEPLPALKDGEILVEAEYLSLDPYMRAYAPWLKPGCTMIGAQVANILDSKHPKFPVGKKIHGYFGWRSHTVLNPDEPASKDQMMKDKPYLLPDFGDLPSSLAVGMLGMPGNTAYFGFLDVCKPKEGETAVVSTAAGAVGMHVGQLAKLHGLKVIGIAGSDAKCKWVVDELGFDHCINYKTQNVPAALKEAAPKGYDCYFDNVGGEIATSVIYQMKLNGRIAVCGSTSSYNNDAATLPKTSILQPAMVFKQLRMEGFVVTRYADRWFEGIEKNLNWIKEGKLKYRETVTHGFDNMYNAFVSMLRGENTGKAVVKAK